MQNTTGAVLAVPTVPRSRLNPRTGQRSLIARGWPVSLVFGSDPVLAALARTTASAPVCQVSPTTLSVAHTTIPQDACWLASASTVGWVGAQVSTFWPVTVCWPQLSNWPRSPCAHSPEMSRYTLTRWPTPSRDTAVTIR